MIQIADFTGLPKHSISILDLATRHWGMHRASFTKKWLGRRANCRVERWKGLSTWLAWSSVWIYFWRVLGRLGAIRLLIARRLNQILLLCRSLSSLGSLLRSDELPCSLKCWISSWKASFANAHFLASISCLLYGPQTEAHTILRLLYGDLLVRF